MTKNCGPSAPLTAFLKIEVTLGTLDIDGVVVVRKIFSCGRSCFIRMLKKSLVCVCVCVCVEIFARIGLVQEHPTPKETRKNRWGHRQAGNKKAREMSQMRCDVCNIVLQVEQYRAHINGEQHKKRARGETGTQYHCQLCNITISGDVCRDAHERGKAHQSNLAKFAASHTRFPPQPASGNNFDPNRCAEVRKAVVSLPQHPSGAPPNEKHDDGSLGKRGRDEDSQLGSSKKDNVDAAQRLREVASSLERGEYGKFPFVSVKVVCQYGARAIKHGSRIRLTIDEAYSDTDNDRGDA